MLMDIDQNITELEERELRNSFEDALGRDKTSLKKEMGEEGLKEVLKIEKKYSSDPYMLNVQIQDMSDTLILAAFGRVRDGLSGEGENG